LPIAILLYDVDLFLYFGDFETITHQF
jgi:hypothetical protein